MSLTGNTNEEKIWNYLKAQGLTAAGAAGLMGNLYAESGLRPNNLQNTYEGKLGMTDAEYTELVDKGSYTNFVRDSAGYGLAQWTYWSRKEALLAYAKAAGKSIGDLEMQLGYLVKELTSYGLLSALKATASVREASDLILLKFEKPADQSETNCAKRAGYGQVYYDKYAAPTASTGGASMTENELRQKVASIITGWVGATKGSAKHLDILAAYNGFTPLARGYKMQVSDAYCAATVSAAYIRAGIAQYTGTECGVEKFTVVAKGKGIWVENDAYVPKVGDACVYDWDDNGVGDCTGSADHIGIVTKVSGNSFTVTEGNMTGGKTGTRTMQVNGRYIRGFITPDFAAIVKALGGSASASPTTGASAPAASPTTPTATVTQKKATDAAQSFDKTLAGTYTVTAASGLHVRNGAGTSKASMVVLPKGTRVQNYGYYTLSGGVKWLYIQVTYNGVTYTGFSSAQYLSK